MRNVLIASAILASAATTLLYQRSLLAGTRGTKAELASEIAAIRAVADATQKANEETEQQRA